MGVGRSPSSGLSSGVNSGTIYIENGEKWGKGDGTSSKVSTRS